MRGTPPAASCSLLAVLFHQETDLLVRMARDSENADEDLHNLRLVCREMRQLVDEHTVSLHVAASEAMLLPDIRLSNDEDEVAAMDPDPGTDAGVDVGPAAAHASGSGSDCSAAVAGRLAAALSAGAAMGRYHARLNAQELVLSAERLVGGRLNEHVLQAFLAAYLATEGVAAALARMRTCSIHAEGFTRGEDDEDGLLPGPLLLGNRPLPDGVWQALAPHLHSLRSLSLRWAAHGGAPPLARPEDALGLLPSSAQLHSLGLEWRQEVADADDDEPASDRVVWLRRLGQLLAVGRHTIKQLRMPVMVYKEAGYEDAGGVEDGEAGHLELLAMLSASLPHVEVLRVARAGAWNSYPVPIMAVLGAAGSWAPRPTAAAAAAGGAAGHAGAAAATGLDAAASGSAALQLWPCLRELHGVQGPEDCSFIATSLAQLDALCAARPCLRVLSCVHVHISPSCLAGQASYPHVEQLMVVQGGAARASRLLLEPAVEGDDEQEAQWWQALCQGVVLQALPMALRHLPASMHLVLSHRVAAALALDGGVQGAGALEPLARLLQSVQRQQPCDVQLTYVSQWRAEPDTMQDAMAALTAAACALQPLRLTLDVGLGLHLELTRSVEPDAVAAAEEAWARAGRDIAIAVPLLQQLEPGSTMFSCWMDRHMEPKPVPKPTVDGDHQVVSLDHFSFALLDQRLARFFASHPQHPLEAGFLAGRRFLLHEARGTRREDRGPCHATR